MIKPNRFLSLGGRAISKLATKIHNEYFVSNTGNYLNIGDFPNSNAGLDLYGYLKFSSFLDAKSKALFIPRNINQIKIDIGLSFAAPNSALWLENLPDRIVYGFEPNPENVQEILSGDNQKRGKQYHYVDMKYINKRFFVLNAAIDDDPPQYKSFYTTENDPGTSSLYRPNIFRIKENILVPCLPLADFFSLVPWKRFKYIEHIKIDTQGNDLRVLQSAGDYLSQRVVFVTAECMAKGYSYTHTQYELDKFMKSHNFKFVEDTDVGGNKTYINCRFQKLGKSLDYSTESR